MDYSIDTMQLNKEKERRNLIVCNDLARKHRNKANELDLKHQQLTNIYSEFETKVHQKEVSILGFFFLSSIIEKDYY